jgi:hypothetical protein
VIRLFILLVICVALVMHVTGLSAGWAWIVTLVLVGGLAAYVVTHGERRFISPSAMWRCPHCLKRTKLFAGVCHHCGRDVVVPKAP